MNKVELLTKINKKVINIKIKSVKYSPELLLILGIAGAVTGTVLACIATTKIDSVKAVKEDELELAHHENQEDEDELKKRTTAIYAITGLRYAALYAPAVLVTGASLSCLIVSNVILRQRIIGVTAAYASVVTSFKEYRERVVGRYGEDIDKELRYNINKKEVSTSTIGPKGNLKTKTENIKVADPNTISDIARIFDDGCTGWRKDPQANLMFLKCQQTYATKLLETQGYLFLNDVYYMLGFMKTKEGQVCGWVYNKENPIGDNRVDFGIYDITNEKARDFVNGYERNLLLDFNIDGMILDLI